MRANPESPHNYPQTGELTPTTSGEIGLPSRTRGNSSCAGSQSSAERGVSDVILVLLGLLLIFLFFGLGFAVHVLWIVAIILFVLWIIGFAFGRGASSGWRRRFW